MSKRFLVSTFMALAAVIFITSGSVWAAIMSSPNYEISKLNVAGSGGSMASTSYKVGFTVGQTVIGTAGSTNYEAGLGFWGGTNSVIRDEIVYLPVLTKNSN